MILFNVLLALMFSAFFSGTEIAYLSASKIGIELKRKSGTRKGRILSGFYQYPDQFLGTMLVGNNVALVIFTILLARLLSPLFSGLSSFPLLIVLLNTLFGTLIVLLLGEFLPKTIFRLFADRLMDVFTYPIMFFKYFLGIPTWMMTKSSNLILKYVLSVPVNQETQVFTRLDLEDFIDDKMKGNEDELESNLFKNALHLRSVKVRECMIPRTEIVDIDIKDQYDDYLKIFNKTHLSRIIVTEDDIDNVMGYVHHLNFLDDEASVQDAVTEIPFIPEVMNVQDLMREFIKEGKTIACVVNEYGGVSGIITMEDILEEIFGEIEDEHDTEGYVELKLNENEYLFSGRLEIDYINEKYEELELPTGEYTTLSGYLVMTTENIPEEGDEIILDRCKFILVQVSERKIETIRLVKL